MSHFTGEYIVTETERLSRCPTWELRNMVHALRMLPWLNTTEESARLQIAANILYNRAGKVLKS